MKRLFSIGILIILAVIFMGCNMGNPLSGVQLFNPEEQEEAAEADFSLPPDSADDTARSFSGSFNFETLFPVNFTIKVDFYDPEAELVDGDPQPLPSGSGTAFVRLYNENGSIINNGMTDPDGVYSTSVYLPSAPENIRVTLTSEGFKDREIVIKDMVEYSDISRTVSMEMETSAVSGNYSRVLTGLEDTDGDGVPDVYDAYPNDPESSFVQYVPAEGNMTVAYEDLFGLAQAGDADYNDFIAEYRIEESSNGDGISEIRIDAEAVEKLAGYRHKFGVRINSFEGTAVLTGEYINAWGVKVPMVPKDVTAPAEIVLFEDSRFAVEKTAWFSLDFSQDQIRSTEPGDSGLSAPPYNPFLYIINTGHDVHLIGEEALTEIVESKNPDDTFRDAEGFPWALLVPEKWVNPLETERIEVYYPRFTNWRESGGEDHSDWYNYFKKPYIEDNNPPEAYIWEGYEVIGAGTAAANGVYYNENGETWNGNPIYRQAGGGVYKIFYGNFSGHPFPPPEGNFWCIDTDHTTSSLTDLEYWRYGTASLPGLTGWYVGTGLTDAPTLAEAPVFSGTPAAGGILSINYVFADPDDDAEGESLFQWFRLVNPGDSEDLWTALTGETTENSYALTSEDAGYYIKVKIIPVDEHGLQGDAAVSPASPQIGS